ncbi:hypothetical protein OH77DRAFT_1306024 [Trametes cingulata]|nr:hypothetical protein OH77DRAFT_1306024 [Trametes cingulata]
MRGAETRDGQCTCSFHPRMPRNSCIFVPPASRPSMPPLTGGTCDRGCRCIFPIVFCVIRARPVFSFHVHTTSASARASQALPVASLPGACSTRTLCVPVPVRHPTCRLSSTGARREACELAGRDAPPSLRGHVSFPEIIASAQIFPQAKHAHSTQFLSRSHN